MSRSYKHYPCVKDRDSCKWGKRQCNKKIRKMNDVPNGSSYKRMVCKWDYLWDYKSYETWEDYQQWFNQPHCWWRKDREPNYWEWYKWYKMK